MPKKMKQKRKALADTEPEIPVPEFVKNWIGAKRRALTVISYQGVETRKVKPFHLWQAQCECGKTISGDIKMLISKGECGCGISEEGI